MAGPKVTQSGTDYNPADVNVVDGVVRSDLKTEEKQLVNEATEKNRAPYSYIANIEKGAQIGYKYFDFGQDYGTKTMILALQIKGTGSNSIVHVHIDAEDGPEIGSGEVGLSDGVYKIRCEAVTGRHALYLVTELPVEGWTRAFFEEKTLFELQAFTFFK